MQDQDDRQDRNGDEKDGTEQRRGVCQKAESRPGIADMGDAEQSLNDGDGFMQPHRRIDIKLGDLIEKEYQAGRHTKQDILFIQD
jgi:hypothetical protein